MIQYHDPTPLTNDSLFINVYVRLDGCLGGPKRLGVFVFTLQLSPLQAQPWTQSFASCFPLEQVGEKRAEWRVVTVARRLQWVVSCGEHRLLSSSPEKGRVRPKNGHFHKASRSQCLTPGPEVKLLSNRMEESVTSWPWPLGTYLPWVPHLFASHRKRQSRGQRKRETERAYLVVSVCVWARTSVWRPEDDLGSMPPQASLFLFLFFY